MICPAYLAQTSVPYAEKAWESASLGDYSGLEVADIDGDGELEILAMCSGNIINIYSADDYSLEGNITIPSSGGYFSPVYDTIRVAQVDGDAALEVICQSRTINGGFKVIDGVTKTVEWEKTGDIDRIAVADLDADGMAELIVGGNAIEIFDVDTQTSKGVSDNITYWGNLSYVAMFRDIEVGDVIAGGNKEIVALVDEFSGNGRLFILDSQTLEIKLNKSIPGSLLCLELADIDKDGAIEIIIGEGGVSLGSLNYYGHIYVYDSSGTLEWGSQDLGEMINAIAVSDIDDDGEMEIVTTFDRVKILYASNKTARWSGGTNLISVGDDDSLVLSDIDGDGTLDILTRANSYSAGNRVLVYKVNGIVSQDDDTEDDAGDDPADDTGDNTEDDTDDATEDEGSSSFLEDNMMIIVIAVVAVVAIAGVTLYIKKK